MNREMQSMRKIEQLKQTYNFMLEAVKQDGQALQFADPSLRSNRAVVLEAVKQNGQALEWTDPSLRNDRAVVLEAVRQDGWALEFADPSLRNDCAVVLEAVKQDGRVLSELNFSDIIKNFKIGGKNHLEIIIKNIVSTALCNPKTKLAGFIDGKNKWDPIVLGVVYSLF